MLSQLYHFILLNDDRGTTFVEIKNKFPDEFKGENLVSATHSKYENIVFWPEISKTLFDALRLLLLKNAVEMSPTVPLVYLIDGIMINMPLVKRPYQYKTPHWLPVVFRIKKPIVDEKTISSWNGEVSP